MWEGKNAIYGCFSILIHKVNFLMPQKCRKHPSCEKKTKTFVLFFNLIIFVWLPSLFCILGTNVFTIYAFKQIYFFCV